MATLTSGFDFQHGVSYQRFAVTTDLKCTVFELWAWDRQTDGQTGRNIALCPYRRAGV